MRDIDLADDGGAARASSIAHDGAERTRSRALARRRLRAAPACSRRKLEPRASRTRHDANAVWFRIGERDRRSTTGPTTRPGARAATPPARWLSTNHLVGDGYWAWLIPLASGSHSVGIVADAKLHPLGDDEHASRRRWTGSQRHQPRLLRRARRQARRCCRTSPSCATSRTAASRSSRRERWALTGEAGLFLDPFYSPGSDFIAIANTYICELVARDRAGRADRRPRAQLYDQIYHSFYESTLALYTDQYPMFGDPEVLPVKVIWDYTYYWGVLAQFFFQRRLADLAALVGAARPSSPHCQALNVEVQALLRAWSARARATRSPTRR